MDSADRIEVADLATLRDRGVIVVTGKRQRRIAVFADGDDVYAVENNCPHMGFPLDKGAVRDGILTCHWHQARFDLRSGCTFDLWADDVPRYTVQVEGGRVYVSAQPEQQPDMDHHRARLLRGIEQNIGLVQAKSLLALVDADEPLVRILDPVLDFACRNLPAMSEGLIRLGCVARLYGFLCPETAYQALYFATRQIAGETATAIPRRERQALDGEGHDSSVLKDWFCQWVDTRHRDGAERTLLTALNTASRAELADLAFTGGTQRLFAAGGHQLEDINKAFELAEIAGATSGGDNGTDAFDEHARNLLPLLVTGMTSARGAEESTNWHHPVEIVAPLRALERDLGTLLAGPRDSAWQCGEALPATLLGDDPIAIVDRLRDALADGAPAAALAREVSLAAASRLARFATSNEVTDWFNPQHTFVFTNAAYQGVTRAPTAGAVRAVFHGAISVYMDRFLNVPPARSPSAAALDTLPDTAGLLLDALLAALDQRANIEPAAAIVTRYLRLGFDFAPLVDRLAYVTVREDLDFHSLQVLEAAVNQCRAWQFGPQCELIMVGVVRNLAAHCPTRRAGLQTAEIARRLHQGERIFEAE